MVSSSIATVAKTESAVTHASSCARDSRSSEPRVSESAAESLSKAMRRSSRRRVDAALSAAVSMPFDLKMPCRICEQLTSARSTADREATSA